MSFQSPLYAIDKTHFYSFTVLIIIQFDTSAPKIPISTAPALSNMTPI